jgi:hypothetical protein
LAQLRAERAQDVVMRQADAADQAVHFDGFGEARGDLLGQLAEKAIEQNLFFSAERAQTLQGPQFAEPSPGMPN